MDHGIELVGGKYRFQCRTVADVGLDPVQWLASDLTDPLHYGSIAVAQIIQRHDSMPCL
jgi:hypothetical protein